MLDLASKNVNMYLIDKIKSGEINIKQIVYMHPDELCPSSWKAQIDKHNAELTVITKGELVATSTLYTCGKCKNNKCSYFQLQTRSLDEGITNYITCNTCGNFWKQHN